MSFIRFVSMLFVGLSVGGFVQADDARQYTLGNTEYRQLASEQTGKPHELIITLPGSYHSSPTKQYPVLYYLDAYWDTPAVFGVYHGLVYDNSIPELILVGLSYPGDQVDYGAERLRDFTPSQGPMPEGAAGGAAALLQFLKASVVPFVEKQYRVAEQQRALAGSSLGGLFTLYAMYEDPRFFQRYIAISPAAVWDNDYLAQRDRQYAKANKQLPARVFLSYGTEEYAPFRNPIRKLQTQLKKRKYKNFYLQNYQMQDVRHAAVKAEGYIHGLIWVWQDLAPTGPSGLEREFNLIPR